MNSSKISILIMVLLILNACNKYSTQNHWINKLQNDDRGKRLKAIRELRELSTDNPSLVIECYMKMLDFDDKSKRFDGIIAMISVSKIIRKNPKKDEVIKILKNKIVDEQEYIEVRKYSIIAFKEFDAKSEDNITFLIQQLKNENNSIKDVILETLESFNYKEYSKETIEKYQSLISELKTENKINQKQYNKIHSILKPL